MLNWEKKKTSQKLKMWQNSNCDKTQDLILCQKLKNSNCDKTQNSNSVKNSNCGETQIVMKFKNSTDDQTQKIKLWPS